MSQKSLRNRRANLMKKDPRCHWCKRPLEFAPSPIQGGPLPDNFPTLDHLHDRIIRRRRPVFYNIETIVLSCPACNHGRAAMKVMKYSLISMYKAGSFPYPFRWVGSCLKIVRGKNRG